MAAAESTPMRRTRSGCCARAASGHARRAADNAEKFPPPHVRPQAQETASCGSNECFDRG